MAGDLGGASLSARRREVLAKGPPSAGRGPKGSNGRKPLPSRGFLKSPQRGLMAPGNPGSSGRGDKKSHA